MRHNMVLYNAATKELTAKIVYYGPGLGGKTTNLQLLHDRLDQATVGKLLTLSTQTDRTIYFDMLPVEVGEIKGYKIRFQLATVPGQAAFNETRKVVLRGADGIVFVADSRWAMLPKNQESWQNLKDNLNEIGLSFETIPIVIQYNKRDLSDILSVEALQEALGLGSYPFTEGVASAGRGITETFKLISKLTFVDLLRRLQGRKPEDADAVAARPSLNTAPPRASEPLAPDTGESEEAIPAGQPAAAAPDNTSSSAPDDTSSAPDETSPEENRWASLHYRLTEVSERLARETDERTRLVQAAAQSRELLLTALEARIEAADQARIAADKATNAALESLSVRGEELSREIAGIIRQVAAIETALGEKTTQGDTEERARLAQAAAESREQLTALEAQVEAADQARHAGEKAVHAALASLSARGEEHSQEIAGIGRQIAALETALEEKTVQGLREAEDIRSQIAPLLEARDEGAAREQRTLTEIDRLRESFADSIAEIADRLRRAVRDI
jgi:signal recognition particle receptor subunit beta/predicted  nucleic acid-binding Zn-ribbon protein